MAEPDVDQPILLRWEFDRGEVRSTVYEAFRKKHLYASLVIWLGTVATGLVLFFLVHRHIGVLCLAAAVVFPVIDVLLIEIQVLRQGPIEGTATKDGLVFHSGPRKSTRRWREYDEFAVTRRFLFLVMKDGSVETIPRAYVASVGAWEALIALARRQIVSGKSGETAYPVTDRWYGASTSGALSLTLLGYGGLFCSTLLVAACILGAILPLVGVGPALVLGRELWWPLTALAGPVGGIGWLKAWRWRRRGAVRFLTFRPDSEGILIRGSPYVSKIRWTDVEALERQGEGGYRLEYRDDERVHHEVDLDPRIEDLEDLAAIILRGVSQVRKAENKASATEDETGVPS